MAEKFIQHSTNPNSNPFYNHSGAPSEIPLPANKDTWLALVHAMSEQNQNFRKQQNWIQVQMVKLSKFSQNLIKENEQLRSLYKGRTHDITKFLTTMAINTNEITGEHEHRQFLLKELNFFILKQIKAESIVSNELSQSIKEKQQKAGQLNQIRMKMEQQELGQLKVKLRVDFKSSQLKDIKAKQLSQIQEANILEGSVYELIIHNKSLQDQIRQLLNEKQSDYSHVQQEKREYESNYEYILIENKKYKNQILKDKIDLERVQSQLQLKKEKNSLVTKNLRAQMKNYEQNQQRNQQLLAQKQKLKGKIEQTHNRVIFAQAKLEDTKQQKKELVEKVKFVKNQMRQLQQNKNKALDEILYTRTDKIQVLNGILNKNNLKSSEQLKSIQKQRSKVEQDCSKTQEEQGSLRQKNNMYKNLIATIGNPVKQIERIELMSRIRRFR